MKTIFGRPLGAEKRDAAAKETADQFPLSFPNKSIATQYLFRVILPPSLRWVYRPVGKTGTSSLLKLLFEIEFGTKFSFKTTPLDDINPSHEFHMLANSRVFGRALEYGLSLPALIADPRYGVRIALVRNPYSRAVSAWRYLCLSHEKKSRWLELERLRLMAICGFDWDVHPNTAYGYNLFLDYIEAEIANVGADNINEHWRPQCVCLKPEAFQPEMLGKLEDLKPFTAQLCERLKCSAPSQIPHENRSEDERQSAYQTKELSKRCEAIYKDDFERFGY
jgi:hypothetical protein